MNPPLTPHGPGFRFVDRFEQKDNARGTAWMHLDPAAPWFADHFPGRPIMPAVLLAECAAQAAGILWMSKKSEPPNTPLFFAGIERFRVLEAVPPGATVCTEVVLVKELGPIARFDAESTVEGRTVARGRIILSRQTGSL